MPPVTLRTEPPVAVLRIDNPPVNAISKAVTERLAAALDEFDRTSDVEALVICAAGRTFVAGADIAEFEHPDFSAQPFNRVLARIEASQRIVVAALHGTVLGGGLELALACHYRVALAGTRLGFPEVKLGILPGSLGTQRLPRLTGAAIALEMMLSGRFVSSDEALRAGIIDGIETGEPEPVGIAYARALLARGARPRRASELAAPAAEDGATTFAQQRKALGDRIDRVPALDAIVRCVEAAVSVPFDAGEKIESRLFEQCRGSSASKAMRHLFFAEREAARIPGIDGVAARRIDLVGIVGAGTMGRGIATAFATAGLPVVLAEASRDNLTRGLDAIRKNFESAAAKGRMAADEATRRAELVRGLLGYTDLAQCDLVIEAVFEDFALKREVAAMLGRTCRPGAVIATNTSTLDVDTLAQDSGRPADFLGMHFFSPAHVMRLLEIVRGHATCAQALATALQVAKRIGKVPVVSGVCYGFIGNRMLEPYLREAEFMLLEGASPSSIDRAMEALGLAMGPLRMLDLAGIDVAANVVIERNKLQPHDDPAYRTAIRRMAELGRLGQKTSRGFYRYDGRTPLADDDVAAIFAQLARSRGIIRRQRIDDDEIVERCLYPLVNEGARILHEGIAYRPGDIDVVYTSGFGFPDFLGGPMWMADDIGLRRIVDRLDHYARTRGNAFGYWTVSPLLRECANAGQRISGWRPAGIPS